LNNLGFLEMRQPSKHWSKGKAAPVYLILGFITVLVVLAQREYLPSFLQSSDRAHRLPPQWLSPDYLGNITVAERRWINIGYRNNFIYCQVPKAGNELWLMYFRRLNGAHDWQDARKTFLAARDESGLLFANTLHPQVLSHLFNSPDSPLYKFAVVRHPLSRFFSAFNNKIREAPEPTWRAHFGVDRNITVENFIDILTSRDPHNVDVHFQPQWIVCGLHLFKYDHIGRYERLADAWARFQHHLGNDPPLPVPSQAVTAKVNPATKGADKFIEWAQNAKGSEAWDKLVKFYKKDLDMLGYDPRVV